VEALPYIDEGVRRINGSPDQVWRALLSTVRLIGAWLPGPVIWAWGLEPSERTGEWRSHVAVGDTLVGFGAVEVSAPRVLRLRGAHRFARYELRFEITGDEREGSVLHAHSSALFPGPIGLAYRGLVIGTGGHRIAVRALLAQVAERAATLYG
jgi:Polyketide cyclase / dehydrase and lipid transport